MDFADLIQKDPALQWIIARIKTIGSPGNYQVDLIVGDPATDDPDTTVELKNAVALQSYRPQVDDIVHVLFSPNLGTLILGGVRNFSSRAKPYLQLVHPTTSIPNNTAYALSSWVVTDQVGGWDVSASSITLPSEGLYSMTMSTAWSSSSSVGVRRAVINQLSDIIATETRAALSGFTTVTNMSASKYMYFDGIPSGPDKINTSVYQTSGADLSLTSAELFVIQIN